MEASRTGVTLPSGMLCRLGAISCLLLAACSGDDAVAPGGLVSITLSPASASLGVGQTQTITAEGKDQNGTVLTGLSFTWASSDNGVATVANGVATGVSAGTASITASSGGVTSNAVSLTVTAGGGGPTSRVVIDKASLLLPGTGESAHLTAQILDPQGVPTGGAVTWTSSAPDKVEVDATGKVVAKAIGSAQIFAEGAGLRSPPTLVFVAEPAAGGLLVTDAQVVSVGPPLSVPPGESPGVGTEYEVTLTGVDAPAPGTVVLAAETAPVAGKAVSTRQDPAGTVVRLALAPLYQLFTDYDIALSIDLAAFPVEAVPVGSSQLRRGAVWKGGPQGRPGRLRTARADLEPFKAFDCDAGLKAQLIGEPPINLTLENKLTLIIDDRPGYSKHALEGSAALDGSAGLKLKAGFEASGSCNALATINLPVLGWASLVVMPAVRVGLGAEAKGKVTLVQGELGVQGKVGASLLVGWECGGATPPCRALDSLKPINEFKTKSAIPDEHGLEAEVSAQFYLIARLDAAFGLGLLNAEILEGKAGPEQSFNLAFENDQVVRTDYASAYDLKMKVGVEPGSALKKAIEKVIDDDAVGVKFKAEFSTDISESPKGGLTASKPLVRPNEAVNFVVELTPNTINYFLLDYNVKGVELYRKREDEAEFTRWKSMSLISSNNTTYQYQWIPVEADAGKYQFAALVNTQLVTPLLEVGPNSIQAVEVSCFSGGAAALVASGATPVCADTWIGTSSVTLKTPGSPQDNITTHSNITWTYDPTTSGNGVINYTASGSFDLSFGSTSGCTFTLTPHTFEIVNDPLTPSRLSIIDNGVTPPIYSMLGSQMVDFTSVASCPGEDDVTTEIRGFLVPIAQGDGPYTPGVVELTGSEDDGVIASSWNFRRP